MQLEVYHDDVNKHENDYDQPKKVWFHLKQIKYQTATSFRYVLQNSKHNATINRHTFICRLMKASILLPILII